MKTNEITINEKAIAQGMYDMFPEQEKNILSFGMLPAPFMDMMEKELKKKFDTIMAGKMGLTLEEIEDAEQEIKESFPALAGSLLSADLSDQRKKFVSEVSHAVAVEIYSLHSKAGRMVV